MKHEYHFLRCSDYFKEKKTQWRNCFKPSLNLVICTTWRPFCKQLLTEFWASLVCFLILWHKSQKTLITRNKYCLHAQGIIYSWQNKSQETKLVLSIIRWLQITDDIRSVNFFTVYFINFIFLIHSIMYLNSMFYTTYQQLTYQKYNNWLSSFMWTVKKLPLRP